jgi:tRNA pseudouridine55 synthase
MKKVINTYKNLGETPLQALERVRKTEKISPKTPMTYAGRLDPAAEGVLLLLVGDECKKKEKYLGLDKEYVVEVLFGIETDTQDLLGIITRVAAEQKKQNFNLDFQKYVGKCNQEYPAYSSKMLAAKAVDEEMPTKEVEIYSIETLQSSVVQGIEVAERALALVQLVDGEFRQGDIGEEWAAFGDHFGNFPFKIITIKVSCSSGTYMRKLAQRIGKDAGVGALAYSIKRTSVGEYN